MANDNFERRPQPAVGENNPHAKLTSDNVIEIVRRVQAGESQNSLARAFNTSSANVNRIMRGKLWGHLTRKLPNFAKGYDRVIGFARGELHPDAKLKTSEVIQIIARLSAGEPVNTIAREFSVAWNTIGLIKTGRAWRHVPRPEGAVHAA